VAADLKPTGVPPLRGYLIYTPKPGKSQVFLFDSGSNKTIGFKLKIPPLTIWLRRGQRLSRPKDLRDPFLISLKNY
jgi:hypothetical protein